MASGLPGYDEQILLSSMDAEPDATGYSQRSAYTTVYEELRKELADALKSRLQAVACDLPADPPGLPRRLHQGGDGLRPRERG